MGPDASEIAKVVNLWYSAAFGERHWSEVLRGTADLLGGAGSAFFDLDHETGRIGQFNLFRLEPGADEYVARMNAINPRMRYSLGKAEPHIVTDYEILPEQALSRDEFYDWMEHTNDTRYFVGGRLLNRGRRAVFASVEFSRRHGHADEQTAETFRRLAPHISNAWRVSEILQTLNQAVGLIEKLIMQRRCGIVALDRSGRTMMLNDAAATTLRQRDGIAIENGHLVAARSATDRSLRAMITEILKRGPADILDGGGALAIPRPSGRMPFALRIVPCPRADDSGWSELPAVLILIADPDRRSLPSDDTLRALGLSTAETRIVHQLMQGRSLVQAANRVGVAHNTARAHLRSIFVKTHTRSQLELVSVLAEFSRIHDGGDR